MPKSKKHIMITAFDFPPQWGGVATYAWELAQYLHQLGHKVTVVTKERSESETYDFTVIRLKLPQSGLLSLPLLTIKLIQLFLTDKPDHIINTLWLPGAVASYLAQKMSFKKIPYAIIVHGMEIVESQSNLKKKLRSKLKFLKTKTFSHSRYIFCVSQFTKDLLLKEVTVDIDKIIVINNGVNVQKFATDNPLKANKYPRIMSACRLVTNKGLDQMLHSIPDLLQQFPDLQYNIIGDGPDRERLKKIVTQLSLEDSVHFLGRVNHEELKNQYEASHLFVMLSRQEAHHVEGFGLVFLEAALSETPSLGGLSGGIPDAIDNKETGWLVNPTDQNEIKECLEQILMKPQKLQEAGKLAKKRTLENRTWQKQLGKMMDYINNET